MRGLLGAATLGLSLEFIISDQIHPCDQEREVILPVHLLKLFTSLGWNSSQSERVFKRNGATGHPRGCVPFL